MFSTTNFGATGTFQPNEKVYSKQILPAKVRKLYLDDLTADVYFAFENGTTAGDERVPAHKILLAMESDAFKAMFYGDLKETGDVKIVDVSADGFKEFLQFFYFDQIKLTMENVNEVIYLVKKYIVSDCLGICDQFLSESLTSNNVCFIYDIAIRFDMLLLKFACKNLIQCETSSVFESQDFLECTKSVLSNILKFDSLACAESQLFESCMGWIKKASHTDILTKELLRHHLGNVFYEIRFGSMKIQEFADLMPSYGMLFTADEYQEIIQMIASSEFEPKIFKKGFRQIYSKNPLQLVPPLFPNFKFNANARAQSSHSSKSAARTVSFGSSQTERSNVKSLFGYRSVRLVNISPTHPHSPK